MTVFKLRFSLNTCWLCIFLFWILFLTGFFTKILVSPGILQATRLKSLLEMKNLQLIQLKKELLQLQTEVNDLDKNPFIQQKEIRKILGYAAADEIIFDFSNW